MTDNSTRAGAMTAAHSTLMADFNATLAQLQAEGITITIAEELPGRRLFPYLEKHLNVVSLGAGVVIATSVERLRQVEKIVHWRSRDDVFSPTIAAQFNELLEAEGQYLAGPSLANICSRDRFRPAPIPDGVTIELLEGSEVVALYEYPGFDRALSYGTIPERPEVLAAVAWRGGQLLGIAAASSDALELWQIGIDIVPGERRHGLGAATVGRLTEAIFDAGMVPYYASSLPNIASRNLAHSLGFWPAWTEIYAKNVVPPAP